MPAYFLTSPKFYQSIEALPFVRPLYSYHPNVQIDLYPHDTANLDMDWEKMRSDLAAFPANARVLIDFESNSWDGQEIPNGKWGPTYGADVRPEIVAVYRTMLDVAKETCPDCQFMFYNCPMFWLELYEKAALSERERRIMNSLSEAFQSILATSAALCPSFYRSSETSLARQIDYIQAFIAELRKHHPLLPIIPVMNPCLDCATVPMPANEFSAMLHATGASDVILWGTDASFPNGVSPSDEWMAALQAWEICGVVRKRNSINAESKAASKYRKSLAKTIA